MNKNLLFEFTERYKILRKQYLAEVYQENVPPYKRFFILAVNPSSPSVLNAEYAFYQSILKDIEGLERLSNFVSDENELRNSILFLKNHTERTQFTVDYLNIYHTFLAFIITIFAILSVNFSKEKWLGIIVSIFIVKVFVDRSNKRLEVAISKEIINFLEYKLLTI